jgi:hypothetical protein
MMHPASCLQALGLLGLSLPIFYGSVLHMRIKFFMLYDTAVLFVLLHLHVVRRRLPYRGEVSCKGMWADVDRPPTYKTIDARCAASHHFDTAF